MTSFREQGQGIWSDVTMEQKNWEFAATRVVWTSQGFRAEGMVRIWEKSSSRVIMAPEAAWKESESWLHAKRTPAKPASLMQEGMKLEANKISIEVKGRRVKLDRILVTPERKEKEK